MTATARHPIAHPGTARLKRKKIVRGTAGGEHHHVDLPVFAPCFGLPVSPLQPETLDLPGKRQVRRERFDLPQQRAFRCNAFRVLL